MVMILDFFNVYFINHCQGQGYTGFYSEGGGDPGKSLIIFVLVRLPFKKSLILKSHFYFFENTPQPYV